MVRFLVEILVKLRTVENCSKLNNRNNSIHCNKKGERASRARPFVVAVNAVVSVVSVSAVCDEADQVDQVVPAHKDDIDEVHELDPVHRATSGDFCATLRDFGQQNQKNDKK